MDMAQNPLHVTVHKSLCRVPPMSAPTLLLKRATFWTFSCDWISLSYLKKKSQKKNLKRKKEPLLHGNNSNWEGGPPAMPAAQLQREVGGSGLVVTHFLKCFFAKDLVWEQSEGNKQAELTLGTSPSFKGKGLRRQPTIQSFLGKVCVWVRVEGRKRVGGETAKGHVFFLHNI